jgi:hypothetical protein
MQTAYKGECHVENDPLDKKNYRPVSILPTISKVYEMVLSDQLTDLFENIFQLFYALLEWVMVVRQLC